MREKMIKPRYKAMSVELINSYKNELISSDEIEFFLRKEFKTFRNSRPLTGGRISGVYKIDDGSQNGLLTICLRKELGEM